MPGLHLVGDEQHAVVPGHLAQARPEVVRRDDRAGLALDRLHQHGGDVDADLLADVELPLDGVRIAEGHVVDRAAVQRSRPAAGSRPCPSSMSEPIVLPWKALTATMKPFLRVYILASLMAPSIGLGPAGAEEAVLDVAGGDLRPSGAPARRAADRSAPGWASACAASAGRAPCRRPPGSPSRAPAGRSRPGSRCTPGPSTSRNTAPLPGPFGRRPVARLGHRLAVVQPAAVEVLGEVGLGFLDDLLAHRPPCTDGWWIRSTQRSA